MTKHRSSDRDTSVVIVLNWTRTVSRGKPYRASLRDKKTLNATETVRSFGLVAALISWQSEATRIL